MSVLCTQLRFILLNFSFRKQIILIDVQSMVVFPLISASRPSSSSHHPILPPLPSPLLLFLLSLPLFRCSLSASSLLPLLPSHSSSHLPLPPPHPPNWTFSYKNAFAEFALDFAAAAYSADPVPCLAKRNATLVMRRQVKCDAVKDECWAFIALSPQFIVFSARGTRTNVQLVVELIETMTAPKKTFPGGGSVQHYFYASLDAIWNAGFGAKLRELKSLNPQLPILFSGHSLGGAIASLAASRFAFENSLLVGVSKWSDNIVLITFGQPRVGNLGYAEAHDRLVPNSFRIVHRYDLIAHLPYCYEALFRPHKCIPLHNHGPFHHGTEIWYPTSEMDPEQSMFAICEGSPFGEDDRCSNAHYVHFGIGDHLKYFGKDVDSYGAMGCAEIRKRRWKWEERERKGRRRNETRKGKEKKRRKLTKN